ncbi:MAG: hydrogenase formation protein HypD [Elusimicrobiota bacterium]
MNKLNIMEVCGTHTMAIARHGLKKLFPPQVNLISGPGCPVCVTPQEDIDRAIEISKLPGVTVATFGDMINVPGSYSSLAEEKGKGADVRIVYSSFDALDIAIHNPNRKVVFLGVGFETTSPTIAATVLQAKKKKVMNFSVLPMFKTIPNALKAILSIKERKIDGFIMPGHVSAIIGPRPYGFIAKQYKIPAVITGFEPDDILEGVKMILKQIVDGKPAVEIQYKSIVKPEGNKTAQAVLAKVFKTVDSNWREIGKIPKSGLAFKPAYRKFDASKIFKVKLPKTAQHRTCLCGKILLGLNAPEDCPIFGKACTPGRPVGPCMVSSEGACAAAYKYGRQ